MITEPKVVESPRQRAAVIHLEIPKDQMQEAMGRAYWVAFTRRPELWGWELGGLLALAWVVWRHRLYRPAILWRCMVTGRLTAV